MTQSYKQEDEKTRDPLLHAYSKETYFKTLPDGGRESYEACFHCKGNLREHRQMVDCSTGLRRVVPIS